MPTIEEQLQDQINKDAKIQHLEKENEALKNIVSDYRKQVTKLKHEHELLYSLHENFIEKLINKGR